MKNELPPGQQIVGPGKWPLVGERESLPQPDTWNLKLTQRDQLVAEWTLEQLKQLPTTEITVDIHCVTRWSKLGATFTGVALKTVLDEAGITETLPFVSFVAHSARQHSTSLKLPEVIDETVLAWAVDGQPLTAEHGGPLRNIVPSRYFYKSVKWLKRIDLLDSDRLGYWEAEAGYHNQADPWKEERYLAPDLDRRQARALLESRNFAGRDLRGLRAENLDLSALNAEGALLRDSHFEHAKLTGANFRGANLSNAHFANATLVGADFSGADLEGADLSGADLREAVFTDASFFGASFFTEDLQSTKIDKMSLSESQLAALTDQQSDWVRRRWHEE